MSMDSQNSKSSESCCHECDSDIKVQSHCKVCQVNICNHCVDNHKLKGDKNHEIVSIDKECSAINLTKCETHKEKYCIFQCKDCHMFMCSSCIITEQHRGHRIKEVDNIDDVMSKPPHDSKNTEICCHDCDSDIKVQSHCKVCQVNICKFCVDKHKSKGDKNHEIVSIEKAHSSLYLKKCGTHAQKYCIFQCKDCHTFICSSCLITEQHRKHKVEGVENVDEILSKHPHYNKNSELCCHDCESTDKVQSNCKACQVNICERCVETHKSKGNKNHKIVSIEKADSSLNLKKCETHEQKYCIVQCKVCNKFMCSSCLPTEQHREHKIEGVENIDEVLSKCTDQVTSPFSKNRTDVDQEITLEMPITSEELKNLFQHFRLRFSYDHSNESFIREIINEDILMMIEDEIKSLSKGVKLIKNIKNTHSVEPGESFVFEIDVVSDGDQLAVVQKVKVFIY